jgi:hypothetical protein
MLRTVAAMAGMYIIVNWFSSPYLQAMYENLEMDKCNFTSTTIHTAGSQGLCFFCTIFGTFYL